MSITQQDIEGFERQRLSFWARHFEETPTEVLQGQQLTVAALKVISDQLAALTQALQGKGLAVQAQPFGGPSIQPVVSVTLPLDPIRLNEFLAVVPEIRGYIADSVTQFAVLVPAGGSVTLQIPPPPGHAAILMAPLQFDTTNVGANVTAQVSVDGNNVIGPQGFVIGPAGGIVAGQYTVALTTGVQIALTNPSAQDATIYFFGQLRTMAIDFFRSVYAPLHSLAYRIALQAFGINF